MKTARAACLDLTAVATRDRYRGIGRYVAGLCQAMARQHRGGHGLELQALIARGYLPEVVPLAAGAAWIAQGPRRLFERYALYHAWRQLALPAVLRRAGVDLYHSPEPRGTPVGAAARTVVTCHDLIPFVLGPPYLPRLWPRRAQRLLELGRHRRHDHVIAISEWTRRDLQRVTGLPDERVTVIPHGIDGALFRAEAGADDRELARALAGERPYFLYVGAFDPRRQVELLIERFAAVATECDEDLVLCGAPPPPRRRALERQAAACGIAGRTRILAEAVSERALAALYRRATAHVMLSRYEGFGFTLLEAMACGCPVLALDASCAREIAGEAALLVDPGDLAGLRRALLALARDGELRRELRARGLERAQAFSWERCARETIAVYRSVLSSR